MCCIKRCVLYVQCWCCCCCCLRDGEEERRRSLYSRMTISETTSTTMMRREAARTIRYLKTEVETDFFEMMKKNSGHIPNQELLEAHVTVKLCCLTNIRRSVLLIGCCSKSTTSADRWSGGTHSRS